MLVLISCIQSVTNQTNNYMPWVVALIIGFASAGINIWMAYRNEKSVNRQMQNLRDLSLLEFKKKINAENRQEWLNDLRNQIAEVISQASRIILELSDKENAEASTFSAHAQNLMFCQSKIQLLLTNPTKEEQQNLLISIGDFIDFITKNVDGKLEDEEAEDFASLKNKVIDDARNLFRIHWKEIQELK